MRQWIVLVALFLPPLGGCVTASLGYRQNGLSVEAIQTGKSVEIRVFYDEN